MLQVLQYEARQRLLKKGEQSEAEVKHLSNEALLADFVATPGPDDRFFISRMQEMFGHGIISPTTTHVATAEDCMKFQASNNHASEFVLTASGTLGGLTDTKSNKFLLSIHHLQMLYLLQYLPQEVHQSNRPHQYQSFGNQHPFLYS